MLKLNDGTTETETWVIPASSTPVKIAAVRSTIVPSSVALQVASRQYVDSVVAAKAADSGVVHISGQETIAGVKQFTAAPSVPVPQLASDAANKAYVDQSVSTVGSGSFVARTGDAMTGPLNLPGDPTSVSALRSGNDDGTRGTVVTSKLPLPRTYTDCINAASALLDDLTQPGWAGEYDTWSVFLPGGAADIFPGDGLQVNVPSQAPQFAAVVREVAIIIADLSSDLAQYKIHFANEAAQPMAFQFAANGTQAIPAVTPVDRDTSVTLPADLVAAQITQVSSTTTTLDIGQGVPTGYGVEVRRNDAGWGPDNDRNLVGRFTTQAFTVPRLAKRQDYFLRLFDASTPPLYSQHSALLHIDYPY